MNDVNSGRSYLEYKTIRADNVQLLDDVVNEYLKSGWWLYEGPRQILVKRISRDGACVYEYHFLQVITRRIS